MHANGKNGLVYVHKGLSTCPHCRHRSLAEMLPLLEAAFRNTTGHVSTHLAMGIGSAWLLDPDFGRYDLTENLAEDDPCSLL